jgi:hypothetical protein
MRPSLRFFRHGGIYRSDGGNKPLKPGAGYRLPLVGPEPQSKDARGGATAPCSSSAMSSGRLFLDRVARQHCPSPLHRQLHPKTVPGWGTMDLQRTANSVLTVCLSKRGSRNQWLSRRSPAVESGGVEHQIRLNWWPCRLSKSCRKLRQKVMSTTISMSPQIRGALGDTNYSL